MSDSAEVLPCGCRFYTVDKSAVIEPHAEDCEFYLYALEVAKEHNKPTTFLEL